MKIDIAIRNRGEDLIKRGYVLGNQDRSAEAQGWLASAMNVFQVVFPNTESAHRQRADAVLRNASWVHLQVQSITQILKAMLEDIDAGVIASVANAARGEVFDDFLDHAEHYLNANKVSEAGVIAGVVFEDTARKICDTNGIAQVGVKLDALISDLDKKDIISGIKAKRARAAAAVRTSATHAQWHEFERNDVEATIKTTRELIEQQLA